MTSWSPTGWSVMLGASWQYAWWSHNQKVQQGGLDFHLDTLARELRSALTKTTYLPLAFSKLEGKTAGVVHLHCPSVFSLGVGSKQSHLC